MAEHSARSSVRAFMGSCLVLLGASCGGKHAPTAPPPPVVSVAEVARRDVPLYSEYAGTLDAYVNAEARARVQGVLLEQRYIEGAYVKAGQLLFVIDPKPYEAAKLQAEGALAQAKAALEKANADVARDTPLVAKQAVSRQDLDDAIAAKDSAIGQVASAQGRLQAALLDLGYTRVASPIDGIAGIAQVRIGNLVGQGDPTLLATVSQVDPMRVVGTLAEREYLGLARRIAEFERITAQRGGAAPPDAKVIELVLADGSVFPHTGRFAIFGTQVNPATGTLTVQALFPNPDQLLRPGQYGRVRLEQDIKAAVVVPQRAVTQVQGQDQVAVVDSGDKVALRPVTLGPTSGAFVVVASGLAPGERVVIDGVDKVHAGLPVTAKPADTSDLPMGRPRSEEEKAPLPAPSAAQGASAPSAGQAASAPSAGQGASAPRLTGATVPAASASSAPSRR
jgi:membrane fusion protein (multidrug efflux system)